MLQQRRLSLKDFHDNTATAIAETFQLPLSTASTHIKFLEHSNFIVRKRKGQHTHLYPKRGSLTYVEKFINKLSVRISL